MVSTVFVGSDSLTIFVATTVSIDRGVLLGETVTVAMMSDAVWMRVMVSGAEGVCEVAAEPPPSTATTE